MPFSKNKKKAHPKKPGRKKAQGVFRHQVLPPDTKVNRTLKTPLDCCPKCKTALEDKKEHETIQVDIPRAKRKVTRFVNVSGFCPCCQKRVRSRHPKQVSNATGAAGVVLGPNILSIAATLKERHGMSFAKISEWLRSVHQIDVTPSALCQANQRLAGKLAETYQELISAIRECCRVHADETGWRIGSLSRWLWVFGNEEITVFDINDRSHEKWIKQKCFAHLLNKLSKMKEEKKGQALKFAREVSRILKKAMHLRTIKATLTERGFNSFSGFLPPIKILSPFRFYWWNQRTRLCHGVG